MEKWKLKNISAKNIWNLWSLLWNETKETENFDSLKTFLVEFFVFMISNREN